jgi:NodT family efflux transporter outer membrane factor (OMF) lipoprotein
MVGPNYTTPDAKVNDAWIGARTDAAEAVNPKWWETFGDPTLNALVQSAIDQNLSLRTAGLRVLEARAARGIAVGEFFPQVQEINGQLGANQLSANDVGNGGDRSFSNGSLGIQAAWELDFWGKFRRGIEAADAELLASVADYDAVLVSLVSEVASTYVVIRSLEERLAYARANVQLQEATLVLTRARFKAGAVSELDVSTALATLANTRSLIPELENSLLQSKLVLSQLLGRPPSELAEELKPAAGVASGVPDAPPLIAVGIPAELLRRRPDVRAAERIAAAQSARIGQAVADLYPSISILGSTGFATSTYEGGRTPNLGNIFDADSFAGFVGLGVNWPVFNYGRVEGNIRVQDARYEQAVTAYRQTVLRAAGDVESGLSDFLRSRERAGALGEAVDASRRSVELSLIQYRAGAADFIRVNDAQTALVRQQDALASARASIALGAVRTYRALGGGWEVRGDREFVDDGTIERMRERTDWGDLIRPASAAPVGAGPRAGEDDPGASGPGAGK